MGNQSIISFQRLYIENNEQKNYDNNYYNKIQLCLVAIRVSRWFQQPCSYCFSSEYQRSERKEARYQLSSRLQMKAKSLWWFSSKLAEGSVNPKRQNYSIGTASWEGERPVAVIYLYCLLYKAAFRLRKTLLKQFSQFLSWVKVKCFSLCLCVSFCLFSSFGLKESQNREVYNFKDLYFWWKKFCISIIDFRDDFKIIIVNLKLQESQFQILKKLTKNMFTYVQDTPALGIWDKIKGGKDDIIIFEKDGSMRVHLSMRNSRSEIHLGPKDGTDCSIIDQVPSMYEFY